MLDLRPPSPTESPTTHYIHYCTVYRKMSVCLSSERRAAGAVGMLAFVPPTFLSASPQPYARTAGTSVKTCDALHWTARSTEVCASSEIDHQCSARKRFGDAHNWCHNVGARVCSYEELLNDAAKDSGCALDDARVWTSTCVSAAHMRPSPIGPPVAHG